MSTIVVAIALAGCGPSSGGTTAGPAPVRTPVASATTRSEPPPSEVVTPKPGNPTPVATASPAHATVQSSDLVDQLGVRCGQDGMELGSDRVRAARDGVHFRITGEPGYQVGFEHEIGGGGFEVDLDAPDRVELIPPGPMTVACGPAAGPAAGPVATVTIEDPDRLYRPFMIGLGAQACVSADALYGEDARGAKIAPVKQARAGLAGLRPGDVVQRAGYPVETGRVRVVRSGEVIGSLDYQPDGHDGWLLTGTTLCDGLRTRG